MVKMNETMEKTGKKISNFCPLRSSVIPKHITIDTTTLVHLLFTKENGAKSKMLGKGELSLKKDKIWETFFKTKMKAFKTKDYVFNHMIATDGISCSILLIRRDLLGQKPPKKKLVVKAEQYVDDLDAEEKTDLKQKSVVGIDPNMSDLVYCVNEDASKRYRYTQNQRRQETKMKKYQQIILNEKNHTKVEGKMITEWETALSDYDHKTVNIEQFKAFIKTKLLVNSKVEKFYEDRLYLKLKLNSFYNVRNS